MNPFCPECGWRLVNEQLRDHYTCESCGEEFTGLELCERPAPNVAHGERCHACAGTGTIEIEFTEWHPYGDTTVPEYLVDLEDCPDCDGIGYFLDDSTCIACGLPVKNGCLVQGWEVHEDCMDETLPTKVDTDGKP